jgi:hypothetical protein
MTWLTQLLTEQNLYWYYSTVVQAQAAMVAVVGMFTVFLLQWNRQKWNSQIQVLRAVTADVWYFKLVGIYSDQDLIKSVRDMVSIIDSPPDGTQPSKIDARKAGRSLLEEPLRRLDDADSRVAKAKSQTVLAIFFQVLSLAVAVILLVATPHLEGCLVYGGSGLTISLALVLASLALTYKYLTKALN